MASHLTVISSTQAAGASARAFAGVQAGSSASESTGGLLGLFSSLLSGAASGSANTSQKSEMTLDLNLSGLAGLSIEAGTDEDRASGEDAIAAALDLNLGLGVTTTPEPLVKVIDALAAIKVNLTNGGSVDPQLLDTLNTAMQTLAETLGIDLDAVSADVDFATLLGTEVSASPALSPLLDALDLNIGVEARGEATATVKNERLQALTDKLNALVNRLASGEVAAEKLAALGIVNGQSVDADLDAALARLSAGIVLDPAQVPQEPDLATPALRLTEPVLAGKSAAETVEADLRLNATVAGSAEGKSETDTNADTSGKDRGQTSSAGANRSTDTPVADAKSPDAAKPVERSAADPIQRDVRAIANAPVAEAPADPVASQTSSQQALRVDASASPRVIQAGYQTSQQQLNLPQIAFELGRQITDGNTRFQIRLDPPELGKIDVRLEIDKGGQVNARLTVEKAETLDLMQRDQRGLERALQQAGIDSGKTNLEFSLKQNPFAGQNAQQDQRGDGQQGRSSGEGQEAEVVDEPAPTVNLYRGTLQARGVNIIA